jgi:hypothetical protein
MSAHEINRPTDAAELLDRAERRIAALEERLARLEGSSPVARAEQSGQVAALRSSAPVAVMEEVSSRRGLFRVAGAVASAAVAHSLLSASPAAAADGGNVIIGQANSASSDTTLTKSTNGGTGLLVTNGSTSGSADGVKGVSDSSLGAGVAGSSLNGYGVYGSTTNGYAMFSAGRFGLGQHLSSPGVPTSGNYDLGDIIRDNVGNIYACVGAGSASAGTAVFRKITGPATAGQMHFFPNPERFLNFAQTPGTGVTPAAFVLTGMSVNGATIPVGAQSIFGSLFALSRGANWAWATLYSTSGAADSGTRAAMMTFDNTAYKGGMFVAKLSNSGSLSVFTSQPSTICLDVAGYTM